MFFKLFIALLLIAVASITSGEDDTLRAIPATSSVIIIGAGPSGIAAATRLVQKGYSLSQITILEAQNRIGGRVNTVSYGSNVIEMGAQWVEGQNVVYQLASSYLTTVNADQSSGWANNVWTAYTNGVQITDAQINQWWNVFDSILSSADKASAPSNQSVGDFFTAQYKSYQAKGSLNKMTNQTAWDLFDLARRMENIEDGCDNWNNLSLYGRYQFENSPGGDNVWTTAGYWTLFNLLMTNSNGQPMALSSRINLNSPVSSIQWDSGIGKVKVISKNQTYQSDMVIVTVSLGHLKANVNSMFVPALPQRKLRAISNLGFGTVDKIYLVFPKPFWTAADNWGGHTFVFNTASASSDWSASILGFYTVRNQPNLLEGWITGAGARTAETLSDAVVLQKCSALLKGAIANQLKNSFINPTRLIRSSWATNPYFLGSYSYPSVQSVALGVSQADLATPVKDSKGVTRLLFAGEATNSIHYQTVHGAVESGWREADRIISLVGK